MLFPGTAAWYSNHLKDIAENKKFRDLADQEFGTVICVFYVTGDVQLPFLYIYERTKKLFINPGCWYYDYRSRVYRYHAWLGRFYS